MQTMDSPSARPLVSIVVPVLNGAPFLVEAIESVLDQTMSNWELILVDDGSSDDSLTITEEYVGRDARIRSTSTSGDKGQSAARNAGVAQSRSRFVAFLDQDDRYTPRHLETTVRYLEDNPVTAVVYTDADTIDHAGNFLTRCALTTVLPPIPRTRHPKRSIYDCLSADMFILPGASLTRRDVFDAVGGFDEDLRGFEDDDLFLRIFQGHRIDFLPVVGLEWRLHSVSCAYSERMARSRMRYFRKLCANFPDEPALNVFWRRDVIVPRFCRSCIFDAMRAKRLQQWDRLERLLEDYAAITPKPLWARLMTPLMWRRSPLFLLDSIHTIYHPFRTLFRDW